MTVPLCTLGTKWFVMASTAVIDAEDVHAFKKRLPNPLNNRPIQQLWGREVYLDSIIGSKYTYFKAEGARSTLGLGDPGGPTTPAPVGGVEPVKSYACTDDHTWVSKVGTNCEGYKHFQFCTLSGGYGPGWQIEYGSFDVWAVGNVAGPDVCCSCGGGETKEWSYANPNSWPENWPMCALKEQSPINVVPTAGMGADGPMQPLAYTYIPASDRVLKNDGDMLQVDGDFGNISLPDGIYRATRITLRFPSEHTVHGHHLVGEMQILHRKVVDFDQGVWDGSAMAMVSILLQLPQEGSDAGEQERQFFFKLGMAAIPEANSSLPIADPIDLNVFEKQLTGHYWRYQGSMTYPPCTEGVKWYVAASPAHINARAVASFKRRFAGVVRTRPIQELNGRKVEMGVLEDEDHPTCHDGHPSDGVTVTSDAYVWTTAQGNTCTQFVEYQWCTSSGGYGVGWLPEWGVFTNFVDEYGWAANDACCVCGGGVNIKPHGVVPVETTTPKPNITYDISHQWNGNPALTELSAEAEDEDFEESSTDLTRLFADSSVMCEMSANSFSILHGSARQQGDAGWNVFFGNLDRRDLHDEA
jgi:carbonic anhydrase